MASHFHIRRYIASFVDQATMYLACSPACSKPPTNGGGHTHTCHVAGHACELMQKGLKGLAADHKLMYADASGDVQVLGQVWGDCRLGKGESSQGPSRSRAGGGDPGNQHRDNPTVGHRSIEEGDGCTNPPRERPLEDVNINPAAAQLRLGFQKN